MPDQPDYAGRIKKIQAAIRDGLVDAGVLEQAKIVTFTDVLRIKGGKNADQKSE